jgi:alternate signal-mediated exported protein
VGGGTFTAGSLSLTPVNACDTWNLDTAEPDGSPFDPTADRLVPGDVVTKVCTFTVAADGTHLRATVQATPTAASSGDLLTSGPLTFATELAIGGLTVSSIDEGNDGDTLTVTVRGTFASSSDNGSQTDAAVLPDIDIVTTQAHL